MSRQSESTPTSYVAQDPSVVSASPAAVALQSTDASGAQFDFKFEAVRPGIFRTSFTSATHPLPPFPSDLRPAIGFSDIQPTTTVDAAARNKTITVGDVKAVVSWEHTPVVQLFRGDHKEPLYADLPHRSYSLDGPGVAHFSTYQKNGLYVGLGEKAAPMNLAGRTFQITASDTFGYDAYRTDPLYKHIPLLIHVQKEGVVAIFSTAHSRSTWAIGSVIDGMWGHFKVHRQSYGGLEQYLLVGKTVADVVRLYADVVGYPLLVPRYMMGYVSGGMKYSMQTDQSILGFIETCKKEDIPVSVHQMSSGYTVAHLPPQTRNVFTWNYHRYPDPRRFTKEAHKRGVRLLGNIKPYILDNHPSHADLVKNKAFFTDPATGKHGVARLWSAGGGTSGEGAHIDFTSKFGFQWWYDGCRELKKVGIDAMWNDNNEYNIYNDEWEAALENVSVPEAVKDKNIGLWGRAINTELMGKSSHDACVDAAPEERPMVLTRSATAGTMRYACSSWSGDNVTSWQDMKGSNAISLNAGFSLLHAFGHDIGGFEGPQPTPELLVRWIQLGVHQPRFAINCYKTSKEDNDVGGVIEPWQYPEVTPLVREAIKRRYDIMPYTYSMMLQSHLTALPPMRWTGWGYEGDAEVWSKEMLEGDSQYWLGDSLLVSCLYAPGESKARVYLPKSGDALSAGPSTAYGFLNTNAPFEWLPAGAWHVVDAPWYTSIPVLARVGGAVPVGKRVHTTSRVNAEEDAEFPDVPRDDWRGVEVFPPPTLPIETATGRLADATASFSNTWLEDDGLSAQGRSPIYELSVTYAVAGSKAPITVQASSSVKVPATVAGAAPWSPLWLDNGLDIILPVGEERVVQTADGKPAVEKGLDAKGRRVWHITISKA